MINKSIANGVNTLRTTRKNVCIITSSSYGGTKQVNIIERYFQSWPKLCITCFVNHKPYFPEGVDWFGRVPELNILRWMQSQQCLRRKKFAKAKQIKKIERIVWRYFWQKADTSTASQKEERQKHAMDIYGLPGTPLGIPLCQNLKTVSNEQDQATIYLSFDELQGLSFVYSKSKRITIWIPLIFPRKLFSEISSQICQEFVISSYQSRQRSWRL